MGEWYSSSKDLTGIDLERMKSKLVDNQHQKISGYRDLTQEEIDLMNHFKDLENELAEACNAYLEDIGNVRGERQRQINMAKSAFEEGFMHLVRSVAQPKTPWPFESYTGE